MGRLAVFFADKINPIWANLDSRLSKQNLDSPGTLSGPVFWNGLSLVRQKKLTKLVEIEVKTYHQEVLPSVALPGWCRQTDRQTEGANTHYQCSIGNQGNQCAALKEAILKPFLKKPTWDFKESDLLVGPHSGPENGCHLMLDEAAPQEG